MKLTWWSEFSPWKYHWFFMTFLGSKSEGFTFCFIEFNNTTWSGGIIFRMPSSIFFPGPEVDRHVNMCVFKNIQVRRFISKKQQFDIQRHSVTMKITWNKSNSNLKSKGSNLRDLQSSTNLNWYDFNFKVESVLIAFIFLGDWYLCT